MTQWTCFGLGGNVGTEEAIIERLGEAVRNLEDRLECELTRSHVVRSAPVGPVADQPPFYNMVAAVPEARWPAATLVEIALAIEAEHGRHRAREIRMGPRTIDIDVLASGTERIATDIVTVPHPRMHERRFVLVPLAELVGDDWRAPGWDRTLGEYLAAIDASTQPVTALGVVPRR